MSNGIIKYARMVNLISSTLSSSSQSYLCNISHNIPRVMMMRVIVLTVIH